MYYCLNCFWHARGVCKPLEALEKHEMLHMCQLVEAGKTWCDNWMSQASGTVESDEDKELWQRFYSLVEDLPERSTSNIISGLRSSQQVAFTGLLDKTGKRISYGDVISSGMRRGDSKGWTMGRVVLGRDGLPCLEDLKTQERMEMQWDQELREVSCEV